MTEQDILRNPKGMLEKFEEMGGEINRLRAYEWRLEAIADLLSSSTAFGGLKAVGMLEVDSAVKFLIDDLAEAKAAVLAARREGMERAKAIAESCYRSSIHDTAKAASKIIVEAIDAEIRSLVD